MELVFVIMLVSVIIFLVYLFGGFFEKMSVFDVLFLVLIGVLIGFVFYFVLFKDFGYVGFVFIIIVLIIILFDCGLDFDLGMLGKVVMFVISLGFIIFVIIVGIIVLFFSYVFKFGLNDGCILGCIVVVVLFLVVMLMLVKLCVIDYMCIIFILELILCEVLGIVVMLVCV